MIVRTMELRSSYARCWILPGPLDSMSLGALKFMLTGALVTKLLSSHDSMLSSTLDSVLPGWLTPARFKTKLAVAREQLSGFMICESEHLERIEWII